MQGESTKIYFKRLLEDGHRWQYTDIAGQAKKPRLYFTSTQWLIIAFAVFCTPFLRTGFNDKFVSYAISALSIFVGLFLTLILTAFDKFNNLKDINNPSYEEQRYIHTRKRFFKQFTALTAYAIVISILCIVLLGTIALTDPKFNDSIINYKPAFPTLKTTILFLKLLVKTTYNILVSYFLLDFLVLVLYAVTSIHSYMKIEFDKN